MGEDLWVEGVDYSTKSIDMLQRKLKYGGCVSNLHVFVWDGVSKEIGVETIEVYLLNLGREKFEDVYVNYILTNEYEILFMFTS